MARKIPKGEVLSYATCDYGTEDSYDRFVAKEDLVLLTAEEFEKVRKGEEIEFK